MFYLYTDIDNNALKVHCLGFGNTSNAPSAFHLFDISGGYGYNSSIIEFRLASRHSGPPTTFCIKIATNQSGEYQDIQFWHNQQSNGFDIRIKKTTNRSVEVWLYRTAHWDFLGFTLNNVANFSGAIIQYCFEIQTKPSDWDDLMQASYTQW